MSLHSKHRALSQTNHPVVILADHPEEMLLRPVKERQVGSRALGVEEPWFLISRGKPGDSWNIWTVRKWSIFLTGGYLAVIKHGNEHLREDRGMGDVPAIHVWLLEGPDGILATPTTIRERERKITYVFGLVFCWSFSGLLGCWLLTTWRFVRQDCAEVPSSLMASSMGLFENGGPQN